VFDCESKRIGENNFRQISEAIMKNILTYLIILLPLTAGAADISVYEAGYPQHRDPNVRVENVTDVIHQRSVFFEHNIYVTFAYDFQSWFFKNYDELELEWSFTAPDEIIMHDLYCWVEDTLVVQAKVLDRWTAETMFNEKSSPYREPALMTMSAPDRHGQVTYNLFLFPLVRNQPQRIMIRYLAPARATSGRLRTWLPVSQITGENGGASSLRIVYSYCDQPNSPELIGKPGVSFAHFPADSLWETTLPISFGEYYELTVASPIRGDSYCTVYRGDEESYYQLAVYPPQVDQEPVSRKLLILIDFNRYNTSGVTGELLLTSLKETMERTLSEQDSVSIILGSEEVIWGSREWQAGTQENIDALFSLLFGARFLATNTSQEVLLAAAEFLSYQPGPGEIIWLTNRHDFPQEVNGAEQYARSIRNLFPPNTVFHALDLENIYGLISYFDYGYVSQNFPFLQELTLPTHGNLFFLRFHDLKTALAALFFEKISHFEEIELQPRMQTGYTYSNTFFSPFRGYYPLDFPVIQTGRFTGQFPMTVSVIGTIDQVVTKKEITIDEADITPGSRSIATAYYGQYLEDIARGYHSNWFINDMIDLSIKSNVLTRYTAFLVPHEWHQDIAWDFEDETQMGSGRTDVSTMNTADDSTVTIFPSPNPFNPTTRFCISIPTRLMGEDMTITVFNIMGQKVRRWFYQLITEHSYDITWDATNDAGQNIASGSYLVILEIKDIVKKTKVLYLK
jgi:hypothetical protein